MLLLMVNLMESVLVCGLIKKQEQSFGTFSNHAEMDDEADDKLCEAHVKIF